jgi:hypothetical protein
MVSALVKLNENACVTSHIAIVVTVAVVYVNRENTIVNSARFFFILKTIFSYL